VIDSQWQSMLLAAAVLAVTTVAVAQTADNGQPVPVGSLQPGQVVRIISGEAAAVGPVAAAPAAPAVPALRYLAR
jgi:hypothetical protein